MCPSDHCHGMLPKIPPQTFTVKPSFVRGGAVLSVKGQQMVIVSKSMALKDKINM